MSLKDGTLIPVDMDQIAFTRFLCGAKILNVGYHSSRGRDLVFDFFKRWFN